MAASGVMEGSIPYKNNPYTPPYQVVLQFNMVVDLLRSILLTLSDLMARQLDAASLRRTVSVCIQGNLRSSEIRANGLHLSNEFN